MYHQSVENFVKSLVENTNGKQTEQKSDNEKTNLTINAHDRNTIVIGKHKTFDLKYWGTMLIYIIITVFVFIMYINTNISVRQSDDFANLVKSVSECEGKSINTIHREMRNVYNYSKYSDMTKLDYWCARHNLIQRNCKLKG